MIHHHLGGFSSQIKVRDGVPKHVYLKSVEAIVDASSFRILKSELELLKRVFVTAMGPVLSQNNWIRFANYRTRSFSSLQLDDAMYGIGPGLRTHSLRQVNSNS